MILMVRQLAPTHEGIALELYCFTATTVWVEYERIQSDILIIFMQSYPNLVCVYLKLQRAMIFVNGKSVVSRRF